MIHRNLKNQLTTLFVALFIFVCAPHAAFALTDPAAASCYQNMTNNSVAQSQAQTQGAYKAITGVPPIDATLMNCMGAINQAFNVSSLEVIFTNPMLVLKNTLRNAAISLALNVINQVCSQVLNDIRQVESSVLSLTNLACLPLPDLNLNIGASLNLPHVVCNGVNLLNPTILPAGTPVPPGYWNPWGKQY